MSKNTSLKLFRSYFRTKKDGSLDASLLQSKECFEHWLTVREYPLEANEETAKKFYRALSNHLSGVDGRTPFSPQEEAALLSLVRKKQRWPCFPHVSIGLQGYRSRGFHEKSLLRGPLVDSQKKKQKQQLSNDDTPLGNSDLSKEDQEYIHNFLPTLISYIQSFPLFQSDIYMRGLFSIYRMIMLARTPASHVLHLVTPEYAQTLCQVVSTNKGEDFFVLVLDTLAFEFHNRILAQNELSIRLFGKLDQNVLLDSTEAQRTMLACLYVLHKPGKEYQLPRLKAMCQSGKESLFDTTLYCDPNTYSILVIYGKEVV